MKPKLNYSTRPKKTGAKKRQRLLAQKRRLVTAGYDMAVLDKLSVVKIRELLKAAGKRKAAAPKRAKRRTK